MSGTKRTPGQMTGRDVVDFLTSQHSQIKQLFAEVTKAEPEKREEAFLCLVRLLAVHETAEEEVVQPAVKGEHDGEAVVASRLEEEGRAKDVLHGLEKMDQTTDEFLVQLDDFKSSVIEHAEREETQEFPILERMQDAEQLAKMRSMVEMVESMAPSHPHPHGPDSAIGNMLVGPFVALSDGFRDALKALFTDSGPVGGSCPSPE